METGPTRESLRLPRHAPAVTRYLFLVGLGLYCAAVWYLGWRTIRDELLAMDLALVLAAASLIWAGTWARVFKWRYALGAEQGTTGMFFLSKAVANWSPGRLGEFAPMVFHRYRTARVGAWIMFDRLLEIAVTLALGLSGLALIRLVSTGVFAAIAGLCIAGMGLSCYLLTRRSFFLWAVGRTREGSWLNGIVLLCADISDELVLFTKSLPVTLSITVITKCADLWAVALLFTAFGHKAGFWLVATAKCALAIVSFVPVTPTATGVPHLTQAWLMNEAAEIPYEGLTAVIGVEVAVVGITFWTSCGLAMAFIRRTA